MSEEVKKTTGDTKKPEAQATGNSQSKQGAERSQDRRVGRPGQGRGPRDRNGRNGNNRGGSGRGNRFGGRDRGNRRGRNKKEVEQDDLITKVIDVRRVTRVVRGGKRMRFAALVVVGDGKGKVGFGFKKGMDFQDSVAKATKIAKGNLFKVKLNEHDSIAYPLQIKNKSCRLFMKPAPEGTGLIAGGYLRPVLELAGVKNIFTKNLGSSNKILGVQTTMKALENLSK